MSCQPVDLFCLVHFSSLFKVRQTETLGAMPEPQASVSTLPHDALTSLPAEPSWEDLYQLFSFQFRESEQNFWVNNSVEVILSWNSLGLCSLLLFILISWTLGECVHLHFHPELAFCCVPRNCFNLKLLVSNPENNLLKGLWYCYFDSCSLCSESCLMRN